MSILGNLRKPKPKLRKKTGGTARKQLEDRQGTAVTTLGGRHPAALTVRAYKRSKKVWP